jgi:hypothetical protein
VDGPRANRDDVLELRLGSPDQAGDPAGADG